MTRVTKARDRSHQLVVSYLYQSPLVHEIFQIHPLYLC